MPPLPPRQIIAPELQSIYIWEMLAGSSFCLSQGGNSGLKICLEMVDATVAKRINCLESCHSHLFHNQTAVWPSKGIRQCQATSHSLTGNTFTFILHLAVSHRIILLRIWEASMSGLTKTNKFWTEKTTLCTSNVFSARYPKCFLSGLGSIVYCLETIIIVQNIKNFYISTSYKLSIPEQGASLYMYIAHDIYCLE